MKVIFSTYVGKNPLLSNFIKIRSVWAELFHADRQTDMTKLTVTYRNYYERAYKLDIGFQHLAFVNIVNALLIQMPTNFLTPFKTNAIACSPVCLDVLQVVKR
jgi:hypothetical protein